MRTIVGDSTKKTKDVKTQRIVDLDANLYAVPTNVSQYSAGGTEIKEMETAKHFASEAEKSAKEAAVSAGKAEDFYDLTLEAALEVQNNTDDSFNYLEEIKEISAKIDIQEENIDEAEKQVILHTTAAENAAQIASDSAASARSSEANSAASASSANNSAISSKESEQIAIAAKNYAVAAATEGHQILAQTEAVYDKTIDDVSQAVQSYLKDKGGFDPNAGLPVPDSWVDIFGVRKNLSCMWTANVGGTLEGIPFSEGDVLIYNAELDRYGRFSGQLVTGGGGGGATEFFNDIKIAREKRLVGTDTNGSVVELIKLKEDIVEAGDKTKVIHLLAKNTKSAFVCIANSSTGFDNYEIYHAGNKPTAAEVGAYHKAEADVKFVDVAGDTLSGLLNTTNTIQIKSKEVYHPGNKPPASDIDAVSLTKDESVTGRKKFTQNPIIENNTPALSLKESDTDTDILLQVAAKTLTIGTPATKLVDVDFNNNSVSLSTPKSKTAQGSTADALVRKDFADAELAKKVDKAGGSIGGDLIVTGKVTVEGTGSIFKDINTTGQIKENNIRVYSPANKPNAIDVGALPISGGSVGGAVNVVGNLSTDGTLSEKGQRVYSPNNKPTPAVLGAVAKTGDQMTGALSVSTSGATPLTIVRSGASTANLNIRFNSGTTDNYLGINASGSLRYGTVADLDSHGKRIYHEGFKPTAADVGAIGIDNVYDKTQADARFWQRTETVNRSFSSDAVNPFVVNSESFKNDGSFRFYVAGNTNTGYPSSYGSGIYQGRMSGVNNQGWSLYNDANSSNYFLGKQKADGTGFTWNKIYHEGFKPTAADVGAYNKAEADARYLKLSGGTLTGDVVYKRTRIEGSNIIFRDTAASCAGGVTFKSVDADNPIVGFGSHWDGSKKAITKAFVVGTGATWYSGDLLSLSASGELATKAQGVIYGTNKKPSAGDIGALPITGGTLTGKLSLPNPAISTTITETSGNALIRMSTFAQTGNTPGTYFIPLTKQSARHGQGYETHVTTGLIKAGYGTGWGEETSGFFVGTGGSDGSPTEYFTMAYGGGIKHSKGHTFYSTRDFTVSADQVDNAVVKRTSTGGLKAYGLTVPGPFRTTFAPRGGQYKLTGGGTGSIQITLPIWKSATMLKVYVSVYNYVSDTSFDAVLSGYDFTDGVWHECSALITGASNTPNHPVYFGHNGSKPCIWIGSVGQKWTHTHVTVNKVETGYTTGDDDRWSQGWNVGLTTSTSNVTRTVSDVLVKPGAASLNADEQPTANTLVKRNASGEIAAKGRILVASSNDGDVGAGKGYIDFVSSAGNSFGTVGDIDTGQNMRLTALSGWGILDGYEGSVLQYRGGDIVRARGSGVDITATTKIIVPDNHQGLSIQNGGGWSYLELKAGASQAHIAHNSTAIEGAVAGSLHLRPGGVANGGLMLQPNSRMIHKTSTGSIMIGALNGTWAHFDTDRPGFYFYKKITTPDEFYAQTDKRVFHEGHVPTTTQLGMGKPVAFGGNANAITTAQFLALCRANGAFVNNHWSCRGTWSYAQNQTITDTGVGHIGLAGCTVEIIGYSEEACTVRIQTANTSNNGGLVGAEFIYLNNGTAYQPGWRKNYNTTQKPTPAEIGALPLTGGHLTGGISSDGTIRSNAQVRGFGTGNVFGNAGLEAASTTADPSISFHKEGAYAATLRLIGNAHFGFVNQTNSEYADLTLRSLAIQGSITSTLNVNAGISVNQIDGVAGKGLSLYGVATNTKPSYGMFFGVTTNWGTHGAVSGDWATYLTMEGTNNRGWIFKLTNTNVASLSATGHLTVNNITTGDATSTSWWRSQGDGGWYSTTYGGGIHQTNSTWVNVYGGKKFYVANTSFDSIQVGGGILLANGSLDNTGCGITGVYDATRFQGVFAMGHQYMLPQNGVGGGTLYGITWTHSNNPSAEARKVSGHQMCIMDNGKTYVAAGTGGIWANGTINSNGTITSGAHINAVAVGGSWGHGNTSAFALNNATSTGTAYNMVGVHGGARIQALGGTGGTVRIYPNNGSTHYLDISNSGIQTAAIQASGRITSSSGFSGSGSGLFDIPYSAIAKQWVTFAKYGSTSCTGLVALPAEVLNHLNAGGTVGFRLFQNQSNTATGYRLAREFFVDGSDGWQGGHKNVEQNWDWPNVSYTRLYTSATGEVARRNHIWSQYSNIARVDYQLI